MFLFSEIKPDISGGDSLHMSATSIQITHVCSYFLQTENREGAIFPLQGYSWTERLLNSVTRVLSPVSKLGSIIPTPNCFLPTLLN